MDFIGIKTFRNEKKIEGLRRFDGIKAPTAQMHRVGMRFLVARQDDERQYRVEHLLHKAHMGPGKNMFSSVVKTASSTPQGFLVQFPLRP